MSKFFEILASGMNLNSGSSNRAVDRKGVVTSSPRRPERQRVTANKRPDTTRHGPARVVPTPVTSSKPSLTNKISDISFSSTSTAPPSQDDINLDRAWSISSSIVAASNVEVFKKPTDVPKTRHKKPISASESAINDLDRRRTVFKRRQDNITFRKGQSQSSSSKGPPTAAIRGASSVSSLDSKHKIAPINPLKAGKASSKDKLDKAGRNIQERNRHDNKGLISNNNRLQAEAPPGRPAGLDPAAVEAIHELEVVHRELKDMAREKAQLALELTTNQNELLNLRSELARLKLYQDQTSAQMDQLSEENTSLRCRLRDVAHSPLSDTEKHQLLLDHRQQSSSAPASIATSVATPSGGIMPSSISAVNTPVNSIYFAGVITPNSDLLGGGDTACTTPEWDKHSSASEISVACLQDRIMQMQETHYSTNEELQATLQELADLQTQLTELQGENERLSEEKSVLLESLCRQTERLEDSRTEVDTLKQLLYQDRENNSDRESIAEREQKLVDLLKNAQEEREILLLKQEELNIELQDARQTQSNHRSDVERLADRIKLLESTLDASAAERKQIDQELSQAKEQSSGRHIEISRLTTLLENARAKIDELEQDRALGDKSEMDEMLDNARKEKDALESQVASLQEQLSLCQCEILRLKEQISILQEECKVTRNNAKCTQSELEYKCDQLRQENSKISSELQGLQEAFSDLQIQAQSHLEDKRQLKAMLSETQRHLGDAEARTEEVQQELDSEKRLRQEENAEWEQFQNDLLMTVRVANDFKTEAQQELQQLVLENKMLKDKVRHQEQQIEKLKTQNATSPTPPLRQNSAPTDTQQSVLSSVQQEMAVRRQKVGLNRQDSRLSVKSLIESIENATKQVKGPGSRSSSTSSLNSLTSEGRNNLNNMTSSLIGSASAILGGSNAPIGSSALTPTSPRSDWSDMIQTNQKCPLREQQTNNKSSGRNINKNIITDAYSKMDVGKSQIGKTDDNIRESILSAKGLDFNRRNSYSDLSERKDPLNALVKNGGSKRNALLKWCQNKTVGYRNIDITNFSSSWNDGLALCALLHTYLPDRIPYDSLVPQEKRMNFSLAFAAAESVGIPTMLNINDMVQLERPDWQQVMAYVTGIYKHFET